MISSTTLVPPWALVEIYHFRSTNSLLSFSNLLSAVKHGWEPSEELRTKDSIFFRTWPLDWDSLMNKDSMILVLNSDRWSIFSSSDLINSRCRECLLWVNSTAMTTSELREWCSTWTDSLELWPLMINLPGSKSLLD